MEIHRQQRHSRILAQPNPPDIPQVPLSTQSTVAPSFLTGPAHKLRPFPNKFREVIERVKLISVWMCNKVPFPRSCHIPQHHECWMLQWSSFGMWGCPSQWAKILLTLTLILEALQAIGHNIANISVCWQVLSFFIFTWFSNLLFLDCWSLPPLL